MTESVKNQIKSIVDNWNNGNLTDTSKMIDAYGDTFFEDLEYWLPDICFYYSDRSRIFEGIAKLYIKHLKRQLDK